MTILVQNLKMISVCPFFNGPHMLDFIRLLIKCHMHASSKLLHYGIMWSIVFMVRVFPNWWVIVMSLWLNRAIPPWYHQGPSRFPLLFLLYINDFPSRVHSKMKLYGDNVLLYSYIKSDADCQVLQEVWMSEYPCTMSSITKSANFKSNIKRAF